MDLALSRCCFVKSVKLVQHSIYGCVGKYTFPVINLKILFFWFVQHIKMLTL